jgi:hypothetical protein
MQYSFPPFNEEEKRGLLEQKILDFSKDLFRNPQFGLCFAILLNILNIYLYFHSRSIISLLFYLSFVYFVACILFSRLFGMQRNK